MVQSKNHKLPDCFNFNDIELTRIQDSDIAETVALINHAFLYQQEAKGEPRTNPTHLRSRIKETEFYVAKENGKIVGCVYIEPSGNSLHFGLLVVADNQKGSGLAPAMLKAIEDFAIAKQYKNIGLAYVSVAPWLKKYYEKHGYVSSGEITEWGTIDMIWMHKDL